MSDRLYDRCCVDVCWADGKPRVTKAKVWFAGHSHARVFELHQKVLVKGEDLFYDDLRLETYSNLVFEISPDDFYEGEVVYIPNPTLGEEPFVIWISFDLVDNEKSRVSHHASFDPQKVHPKPPVSMLVAG